jgi:hypothetical protein
MRAFAEGVVAGLGIAVPVGAIAVLIVDPAIRRGFRCPVHDRRKPLFVGSGPAGATCGYASASIPVPSWLE